MGRCLLSLGGLAAEFASFQCEGSAGGMLEAFGIVAALAGIFHGPAMHWVADYLTGGQLPETIPTNIG